MKLDAFFATISLLSKLALSIGITAATSTGNAAAKVLDAAEMLGNEAQNLRNEVGRFLDALRAA